MSRSLSESPSAPFKAMLSHNRPRHIRLANAAVSSNFVSLQSRWARYLRVLRLRRRGQRRTTARSFSVLRWPIWRRQRTLKMEAAVHTVRAEVHPPRRVAACSGRVDRRPWFRLVDSTGRGSVLYYHRIPYSTLTVAVLDCDGPESELTRNRRAQCQCLAAFLTLPGLGLTFLVS